MNMPVTQSLRPPLASPPPVASHRADWIDVAKGMGIFLVVYGHVARGLVNGGVPMDLWWFAHADALIYSFHMPLFFLLSGWFFVGSLTRRGPKDYLVGRVATVLYPYVLWSLLQGGVELLLSGWTSKPLAVGEVLALGWAPRAQFWFLYALFLMSLLALLLCFKQPRRGVLALILLGGVAFALQRRDWPMPLALVSSHLLFFALGAWLGARRMSASAASRLLLAGALVSGVAVLWMQSQSVDWPKAFRLAAAVFGTCLVMLLAIALDARRRGAVLASFGRGSMAIFLLHILVASGVRIVLLKVMGIRDPAVHLVAGVTAGMVVPWCVWRWAHGRAAMALFEMPPTWRQRLLGHRDIRTATA
ncbi:acyltransferase family protein [Roseateles amylovorans]|uniref:Acyltransferase n=1 Tax=Roseateles amylovorans TaxID=2978473 RepID=A0ABY6B3S5_9BURK|nr:acyltransferase [Roseateles amylovorans]UXH79502.1 acyltransferase [Roseateles amylovorans]